jgi:glutathione-dependent peroxiredoxin
MFAEEGWIDPFSLATWAKNEGADQVRFIPDVNGNFTRAMGMLVDRAGHGAALLSLFVKLHQSKR